MRGWWWYVPLGVAIWALLYNGGIHATVAGVVMGLILRTAREQEEKESPAERTGHLLHPLSAGVCVPLFAAGVSISGDALGKVFTTPEPLGVIAGLVAGKILGIFAGTYLAAGFTRARLNPELVKAAVLIASLTAALLATLPCAAGMPFTGACTRRRTSTRTPTASPTSISARERATHDSGHPASSPAAQAGRPWPGAFVWRPADGSGVVSLAASARCR